MLHKRSRNSPIWNVIPRLLSSRGLDFIQDNRVKRAIREHRVRTTAWCDIVPYRFSAAGKCFGEHQRRLPSVDTTRMQAVTKPSQRVWQSISRGTKTLTLRTRTPRHFDMLEDDVRVGRSLTGRPPA